MGPSTVFGAANALAAASFDLKTPSTASIMARIPIITFWVWMNLLPFAIDNQRRPEAIAEDKINKPWRSLPSGRLTPKHAGILMLVAYPLAFTSSFFLGGLRQCLILVLLGIWYNDMGGSDSTFITRNLINALGYVCFTSGAMEVAIGHPLPTTPNIVQWFLLVGLVVATTVQTQDLSDQAGDSVRNRRTAPLVLGDIQARWTIALLIPFWSYLCPWFWSLPAVVHIFVLMLGILIAARTLLRRMVHDDKLTFKLWTAWTVVLFLLPSLKGLILT